MSSHVRQIGASRPCSNCSTNWDHISNVAIDLFAAHSLCTTLQELQRPAYVRTTATILARINYRELAAGLGVGYRELTDNGDLDAHIRGILCEPGPVLVHVRGRLSPPADPLDRRRPGEVHQRVDTRSEGAISRADRFAVDSSSAG